MAKKYGVCGLGTAIVDVLVQISDHDLKQLGFEKGSYAAVDSAAQQKMLAELSQRKLVSGGSVANSMVVLAQLGTRSAFICSISADEYGQHYRSELNQLGIDLFSSAANGMTGTCISLITPDAERTMRTHVGVGGELGVQDIVTEVIADSEWLFIEGYILVNSKQGMNAIREAITAAKKNGTKIAFTISAAFIVEQCRSEVEEIVAAADLVFANIVEARSLTRLDQPEAVVSALLAKTNAVVVTMSEEGAYFALTSDRVHIPAFECRPVDQTGAGAVFAGAVLHGILQGRSLAELGRGASYLAMNAVCQVGARLNGDVAELYGKGCAAR